MSRTECAGRDKQVGLCRAPLVAIHPAKYPAPRQRALPALRSNHANKTREGARARAECAVQDGAKQVGLPGRRWNCHIHRASQRRAEPLTTISTRGAHTP